MTTQTGSLCSVSSVSLIIFLSSSGSDREGEMSVNTLTGSMSNTLTDHHAGYFTDEDEFECVGSDRGGG